MKHPVARPAPSSEQAARLVFPHSRPGRLWRAGAVATAFHSLCAPLLALCLGLTLSAASNAESRFEREWPRTDFSRTLIDLDEVRSGGPPRDGIPPIDVPDFVAGKEADDWLDPREPVIVVSAGEETRAYPLQILTWHEIVNDEVGGVPLSVTFCPLCNASIVFDRRVGGRVLDFGTTGKLRKSDLVMWDRQTESWWQQFTGRAVVGDLAGDVLGRLPASIVAYEDFRRAYPQARVLSRRTGHERPYGSNPYRGYDSIEDQPFLFFDPIDERLPPMERVLNISVGDHHKLYPFSALSRVPVVNDEVAETAVVVFSRDGTLSVLDESRIGDSRTVPSATAYARLVDGRELHFEASEGQIVDRETGSTWNLFGAATSGPLEGSRLQLIETGVHFAFAWLAFNPKSEIWRSPD